MAYELLVGPPKVISFYYTVDGLFNKDSLWSMYKAINKVDNEGNTLLDELSITEDERDIFLEFLSDGVFDVFARLLKYTKGITANAILFNEAYVPDGGVSALSCVVKIIDQDAYNDNYLSPIDKTLEKCLRFYVLKEWMAMKDLDSDAVKFGINYNLSINKLLRHSMQLKKAAITVV
jgi:hypothetical protein